MAGVLKAANIFLNVACLFSLECKFRTSNWLREDVYNRLFVETCVQFPKALG